MPENVLEMCHVKQCCVIFQPLQYTAREGNGDPLQYSCLENPMDGGSLVGWSPWGREESDTTEQLHFHFSLSCIGGGNGNSLQCSCLESSRDGRAWWAAVYGVVQSRTRLKRLSICLCIILYVYIFVFCSFSAFCGWSWLFPFPQVS